MIELYLAGAALTALHLWRINRPREHGGWIAYSAFIAAWPLVMLFALYHAARSGLR